MTPRQAVLCLAGGQMILWAGLYYSFPALLLHWEAAGWPKTRLTAAFAGAVMVSALVAPLTGRLIDRGRGPLVMTAAALGGTLLLALLPLASTPATFTLLWLGIGVAMGGCLYEPCFALLTRTQGSGARRAITLVTLIAGFAGTLSFPLNNGIAALYGWPAATLTLALVMLVLGVPLLAGGAYRLEAQWQARPVTPAVTSGAAPVLAGAVLRQPAFWLLALAFSLLALNHGLILNHLLPILQDRGIGSTQAVLAAALLGPLQVAGRLLLLLTEQHLSSLRVTTLCFVVIIAATASLLTAAASPLLLAAFVVLHGSGYGILSILRPVVLRDLFGEANFGLLSGVMAVPYLLLFALAPLLGSLLWQAGGYALALAVAGGLALLGLLSYQMALVQQRVTSPPASPAEAAPDDPPRP